MTLELIGKDDWEERESRRSQVRVREKLNKGPNREIQKGDIQKGYLLG